MPREAKKENSTAPRRGPEGMLVLRTQAMPKDANPNGDIFGGWVMCQMDIGGGLLAMEVTRGRVVTITVDKMTFVSPIRIGDTICIYGNVIHIGNSSMDIKLEVWAKALIEEFDEQRRLVTEAVFRYVAIGENRRPRRIPDNPRYPRSAD